MPNFDTFTLRHASNSIVVQDGFDTYAIRGGGTEVWAATSGENLSRLKVEIADADVVRAARAILADAPPAPGSALIQDTVGTPATEGLTYDAVDLRNLQMHIGFAADMTESEAIPYLWDVIKALHSNQQKEL